MTVLIKSDLYVFLTVEELWTCFVICHLADFVIYLVSHSSSSWISVWNNDSFMTYNVLCLQVQSVIHPLCQVCHLFTSAAEMFRIKMPFTLCPDISLCVNFFSGMQYWSWWRCAWSESCLWAEGSGWMKCILKGQVSYWRYWNGLLPSESLGLLRFYFSCLCFLHWANSCLVCIDYLYQF